MSKPAAHVAGAVHHARTAARQALGGHAPHSRKSHLTHAPGTRVVDAQTGQEGVIVSGKKVHVPTQSPG